MNQKIVGIIPLMVAMLFVAGFAVGDNSVAAATTTASQTATVTVPESIGLNVNPGATMTATGTGVSVTSNSYNIANGGNSRIDVSVYSGSAFTCPTSVDTIPIVAAGSSDYTITIGSTTTNIPGASANKATIITNMATLKQGGTASATQTLAIPTGLEQGTYTNTLTYTAITHTP